MFWGFARGTSLRGKLVLVGSNFFFESITEHGKEEKEGKEGEKKDGGRVWGKRRENRKVKGFASARDTRKAEVKVKYEIRKYD